MLHSSGFFQMPRRVPADQAPTLQNGGGKGGERGRPAPPAALRQEQVAKEEDEKAHQTPAIQFVAVFRLEGVAYAARYEKRGNAPSDGQHQADDQITAQIEADLVSACPHIERSEQEAQLRDEHQHDFGEDAHLPPLFDGDNRTGDGVGEYGGEGHIRYFARARLAW